MRVIGKEKFSNSYEDRWSNVVRAAELVRSLGVPSFRQVGVFRGSQKMFDQMDAEIIAKKQRWLKLRKPILYPNELRARVEEITKYRENCKIDQESFYLITPK
jgi:hypothetical protein